VADRSHSGGHHKARRAIWREPRLAAVTRAEQLIKERAGCCADFNDMKDRIIVYVPTTKIDTEVLTELFDKRFPVFHPYKN
jgi:hypothetical protein